MTSSPTSPAVGIPADDELREVEALAVSLVEDAARTVAAAFGQQIEVQPKPRSCTGGWAAGPSATASPCR